MNIKTYYLDTNIILQQPNSLLGFEDNNVVLTSTVLKELDRKKTEQGECGYSAREAVRIIQGLKKTEDDDYITGLSTPGGGKLILEPDDANENYLPPSYSLDKADNRIINSVLMRRDVFGERAILVTSDILMRIQAVLCGLPDEDVQGYHNEEVSLNELYKGKEEIYLSSSRFNKLYKNKTIPINKGEEFIENEFLLIHNSDDPNSTALAWYKDGNIMLINTELHPFNIKAKNASQKFALAALMAPAYEIPLVILRGAAGTSKTFLSLASGLDSVLDDRKGYQKVMITRNNILSDVELGYLPGSLEDKMGPLIAPFYDNCEALIRSGNKKESPEEIKMEVEDLFAAGTIEIASMAYMRGRSLYNTYLIVDEAQNATPAQILEIISRAGEGCKVVIAGDPDQIDNPKLDKRNNGLSFAAERMKGSKLTAQITFEKEESVRSPLAMEAAIRLTKHYKKS